VLASIQRHLQEIYELDVACNVHDFLITSRFMPAPQPASREQLLLVQEPDELLLSLYLHEEVVNKLAPSNGNLRLHPGNLECFCLALEGISHFLYVIWNAAYGRRVTRLEMEVQAEIDKFIMVARHLEGDTDRPPPGRLLQLLFDSISFRDDLSADELQRYRDANTLARRYCTGLAARYTFQGYGERSLLRELRRFYRLGAGEKLRRINRLH